MKEILNKMIILGLIGTIFAIALSAPMFVFCFVMIFSAGVVYRLVWSGMSDE